MMIKLFSVFVLVIAVGVNGAEDFHCIRPGQICLNDGVCVTSTGICTCVGNFFGYACHVEIPGTSVVLQSTSSTQCDGVSDGQDCEENSGQCYVADGTAPGTCVCPANRDGTYCETELVRVSACDATSMTLSITLPSQTSSFDGVVYLVDPLTGDPDSDCGFDTNSNYVYTKDLNFLDEEDACNDMSTRGDSASGTTGSIFSYTATVAFRTDIYYEYDVRYIFECDHTTTTVSASITANYDVTAISDGGTVQNAYDAAYLTIYQEADYPTTLTELAAASVGDAMVLQIGISDVAGASAYTSILPLDCTLYPSDLGTATISLQIIADGCLVASDIATPLINDVLDQGVADLTKISIHLKAFKFQGSETLYAECSVRLCSDGDTTCAIPSCTGRRKRRQAEGLDGSRGNVTNRVFILPREIVQSIREASIPVTIVKSCLQSTVFIVVTAVLGLLVLFAITVALTVCIKWSNQQRNDGGKNYSTKGC